MKMLSNTEECLCKLKYDRSTNFKILEGKREINHIVTKRQCNEIFFFDQGSYLWVLYPAKEISKGKMREHKVCPL